MNTLEEKNKFIAKNSPDGGFLQSQQWADFQQAFGRKVHELAQADFLANLIEHELPMVGKYFYCPRGPVTLLANEEFPSFDKQLAAELNEMIALANKENIGWIRIEPATDQLLGIIRANIQEKIVKAPHDVQPKEIFVVDISKDEKTLLAEMKSKTRYNIGIAQKKGVKIISCSKNDIACMPLQLDFLRLTKEMAARQGISAHPETYYRKMIESFPADKLRLYAAEYAGKIISINLVLFFEKTATYLHGASSNEHRNVMAPYLLQWQAMLDAKNDGCAHYDFGGVQTSGVQHVKHSDLSGVTNFKMGFSPQTSPIVFSGSYDILVNPRKYGVYRGLQRAKALLHKIHK